TSVAGAKAALDTDDIDKLKAAFDDLTQASHKLAEVMYQQGGGGAGAAPGGPPPSGSGGSGGSDDVIDAEYEDA
ncbi:MAG: molecular chaperone DnaK, partial [Myxococcales bacterium]|nr:molecular chaperone DnaK [Myxococcales bacterium]